MIWPALAWEVMRLAVCTAAPNISRSSVTTDPKWQPTRIATLTPSATDLRVIGNLLLHLTRSTDRIIGRRKGRHDLIAHGLNDRTTVLIGGLFHDLDALLDGFPREIIPHGLVELRTAHNICEQDGEMGVFADAFYVTDHRKINNSGPNVTQEFGL